MTCPWEHTIDGAPVVEVEAIKPVTVYYKGDTLDDDVEVVLVSGEKAFLRTKDAWLFLPARTDESEPRNVFRFQFPPSPALTPVAGNKRARTADVDDEQHTTVQQRTLIPVRDKQRAALLGAMTFAYNVFHQKWEPMTFGNYQGNRCGLRLAHVLEHDVSRRDDSKST